MKRTRALAILALVLASSTAFATPLKWLCNWPETTSQTFSLYQGETATFEPTFRINGEIATNLAITAVYYQTNGMGNAWWRLDNATFAPSNDVGAASYRFFVAASPPPTQNSNSNSILYRANGTLRMLHSPGFAPNVISPPIETLDFDAIEVLNPPYYTRSETEQKIVELAPTPDLSGYATKQGLAAAASAATNYTDAARASLSTSLAVAAQSATNYTDSAIQALPDWAKAATKPSYTLNEVCPEVENWLGVPGTTAAGKSIKVLAKTVNGIVDGGLTVTGSSNNDNNTTKYRYGGVTATRNGANTDYLFDTSSQSGVVRRSELAGLATGQSLAAAAQSATNYTDSIAIDLRGEIAEAVPGDYANVSNRAARAVVHRTDDSTAVDIGQRMTGTTVGSYSLAEGYNTTASEYVAHAEGYYTTANNQCAHAEGNHTIASGVNAHAEGFYTKAQHLNEHAQGVFNDSHGDTLSSIGFGTDENDRRNAVETMKDGKTYIYGLGGYDGTNPTNSTDLAAAVNAKVSTDIFRTATNALAASTAAALALKADLAKYRAPTLTTADNWLCEWSGEVLPLHLASPIATWQKGYNAQPVLMFVKNATWQLNAVGSTILTLSSTAETAATLDFGGGYALTRLGPLESSVVYSDELDRAIASAEPGNYATVSNKAMTALQSYTETDPTIGLTNGTIYVKGSTITPLTSHQSLSGYVPTSRKVNNKALSADITLSASDVGAAPASLSSTVTTLSGKVGALESWSIGDDTQLKVEHAGETNATLTVLYTNKVMYSTVAAESNTLAKAAAYTDRTALDLANAVDAAMATDPWGDRTSSGAPAPADSLIIEKQKVALTGGGNFARIESSTGGYWVMAVSLGSQWTLESLADAQNPSNPSTVTLYDAEGNAVQTVTSTASREAYAVEGEQYIYCDSSGANDVITLAYPIVADSAPTLLFSPVCTGLDGFDTADQWPSSIASVVASGASGMWTNTVTMVGHPGVGFFRAKYTKAGQTYTRFDKPLGLSTVTIGDVTYSVTVETINGKKLMVLTEVN